MNNKFIFFIIAIILVAIAFFFFLKFRGGADQNSSQKKEPVFYKDDAVEILLPGDYSLSSDLSPFEEKLKQKSGFETMMAITFLNDSCFLRIKKVETSDDHKKIIDLFFETVGLYNTKILSRSEANGMVSFSVDFSGVDSSVGTLLKGRIFSAKERVYLVSVGYLKDNANSNCESQANTILNSIQIKSS
jgi:hypothetical protein